MKIHLPENKYWQLTSPSRIDHPSSIKVLGNHEGNDEQSLRKRGRVYCVVSNSPKRLFSTLCVPVGPGHREATFFPFSPSGPWLLLPFLLSTPFLSDNPLLGAASQNPATTTWAVRWRGQPPCSAETLTTLSACGQCQVEDTLID